jgi:hypothetical protein
MDESMRTVLQKNSDINGLVIPGYLLENIGSSDVYDLSFREGKIVIELPGSSRNGWYGYIMDEDIDAWKGMAIESDSEDWEW